MSHLVIDYEQLRKDFESDSDLAEHLLAIAEFDSCDNVKGEYLNPDVQASWELTILKAELNLKDMIIESQEKQIQELKNEISRIGRSYDKGYDL